MVRSSTSRVDLVYLKMNKRWSVLESCGGASEMPRAPGAHGVRVLTPVPRQWAARPAPHLVLASKLSLDWVLQFPIKF